MGHCVGSTRGTVVTFLLVPNSRASTSSLALWSEIRTEQPSCFPSKRQVVFKLLSSMGKSVSTYREVNSPLKATSFRTKMTVDNELLVSLPAFSVPFCMLYPNITLRNKNLSSRATDNNNHLFIQVMAHSLPTQEKPRNQLPD